MNEDRALIEELGGPAAVADMLGYDKRDGGIQRVSNWLTRGIPAAVKLERPDLFLRHLLMSEGAAKTTQA